MMPQLEVYVDGQGSVFRTAERGYLRISIASRSTNQSQAFHEVQTAVAALTTKFRALATKTQDGYPHPDAAITAFTLSPLSTASFYQRDNSYQELKNLPKEHSVSSSAEIIFRNMEELANVSNELATMPPVSISGTEWKLTEATRVEIEREARLRAVRDAVQKAQDYAGVVGRQVVAVEIKDGPSAGARSLYQPARPMMQQQMMQQQMAQQQMAQQRAAHPASVPAVTTDGPLLEPKTITVSAQVSVKFVSSDEAGNGMELTA